MKSLILVALNERIGDPALGIIIPGLVLLISIILTWLLYKKFSSK